MDGRFEITRKPGQVPLLKQDDDRPQILRVQRIVGGPMAGQMIPAGWESYKVARYSPGPNTDRVLYERRKIAFGARHALSFFCPADWQTGRATQALIGMMIRQMAGERVVCSCRPEPDGVNDACPLHGEDALCDCGHPRADHEDAVTELGTWREVCSSCSCLRFRPEHEDGDES